MLPSTQPASGISCPSNLAGRRGRVRFIVLLFGAVGLVTACAAKVVPPVPGASLFPEFVFPSVPLDVQARPEASDVMLGWRYVQGNQLALATEVFRASLRRAPRFHPAVAGVGYVALAGRDHAGALAAFDEALVISPGYVSALVGRGLSLLAAAREDEARAAFEDALALDSSLADVRRRVDILRFRQVQRLIEVARGARDAGRQDDASVAYQRAIAVSPESGFLHRELGAVERARGSRAGALARYREATRLDAGDVQAWIGVAELLEAGGDHAGAERTYRTVLALDPSSEVAARLAALGARTRDVALPVRLTQIAESPRATRADLAALLGMRVGALVAAAPKVAEVITDVSGHWAESWIAAAVHAGVIELFPNHTFQPDSALRRIDLARAAGRLLRLSAAARPDVRAALAARPRIADIGARHPNYQAAAASVAAGLVPLRGERFEGARVVSGAEAQEAVERLRTLLAPQAR